MVLTVFQVETPLGMMKGVADEKALYVLDFAGVGADAKIEKLSKQMKVAPEEGRTPLIESLEKELAAYFAGALKAFATPISLWGTPFQQRAWQELLRIPYGETKSYAEQAVALKRRSACRAVGNANGANPLVIIIPCHRIIRSGGELGGYGGGVERKQALLELEQKYK